MHNFVTIKNAKDCIFWWKIDLVVLLYGLKPCVSVNSAAKTTEILCQLVVIHSSLASSAYQQICYFHAFSTFARKIAMI